MPEYRPGLPAVEVDRALRGAAEEYDRARQSLGLWFTDALERRVYRDLGYASMEIYARGGLGFSPGRTRQFLALARGRARERRTGAAKLDLAAPAPTVADPPTTIAVQLDGFQLARFDALVASAKKAGAVAATASRGEIILASLAALTENTQRVRRHAPAAIACDHTARDERGHNRSAIPPAVRRQVMDRDGHRCRTAGCGNSVFLELHHVVPRSRGGTNRAENLVTLCSRCHRYEHTRSP
jgi:hypothetical protein